MKLNLVTSTDDLIAKGDYYICELSSTDEKIKPHESIIINCPFCNASMASTSIHKIIQPIDNWLTKLRKILHLAYGITVTPMLQCPYSTSHTFKIINGRIKKLDGKN